MASGGEQDPAEASEVSEGRDASSVAEASQTTQEAGDPQPQPASIKWNGEKIIKAFKFYY
jgi:hypothetical protein